MRAFVRWCKFNRVGAAGMVVQLALLAALNAWWQGHLLIATAAAIEVTLLRNFMWHIHYTWRDSRGNVARMRRFVRFHLSNGLVSMLGNLALMPFLVRGKHLPVVAANAVAVVFCSGVNFCLGDSWVFALRP